jgi:phage tail-like protein
MASLELPALYVDDVALEAAVSRPILVNRDPGPGEQSVPLDAFIALELVDPGLDGIDRAATQVFIDEEPVFVGGAPSEIAAAFAGPRSGVSQTADTLRVVLDPIVPLASEAQVTVRVVSRTVGGAGGIDESYEFTVEDRTAPRVVAAQATGPRLVRVAFDELVAVPEGATFQFRALAAPAVPIAPGSARADGILVSVELDTDMTPGVMYEVRAEGVTDLSENPVLAPFNRALFEGFRPARPPGRRFDLWQMIPKHNRRDDLTRDLFNFIACLQEVMDLLLADADRWPDIFDLERAPERFLDLILEDLGNPFAFDLDVVGKRRLAAILVDMYRQKGTAQGIRNAIRFFLGIEVVAITAFNVESLGLGEAELGVNWVLAPSERFSRYAFSIEVNRVLTPRERRELRAIVDYLKPAHTHFVDLIEPSEPEFVDDWELGISELGISTDLH